MFYPLALPRQLLRSLLLFGGLWLLLLPAAAQAPDTAALRINSLPPAGLPLAKGWRYHSGDNPAWARLDFDDSRWDTLNPARPRHALPPRLSTGISWLRLRLSHAIIVQGHGGTLSVESRQGVGTAFTIFLPR